MGFSKKRIQRYQAEALNSLNAEVLAYAMAVAPFGTEGYTVKRLRQHGYSKAEAYSSLINHAYNSFYEQADALLSDLIASYGWTYGSPCWNTDTHLMLSCHIEKMHCSDEELPWVERTLQEQLDKLCEGTPFTINVGVENV